MKSKSIWENNNVFGDKELVKVYCLPLFKEGYRDKIKNAIAVIFDVFRASTTIIFALHSGFTFVVPVKDVKDGLRIAKKINAITAGERGGKKIKEFHLSNSPYQVLKYGRLAKPLVLSSTNGTRIIKTLEKDNIIVVGSTVNAKAVAEYTYNLAIDTGKPIVLIAAGRLTGPIVMNAIEDMIGVAVTSNYLKKLGANLNRSCRKFQLYRLVGLIIHKVFSHTFTFNLVKKVSSTYIRDIILTGLIDVTNIVPVFNNGIVKVEKIRKAMEKKRRS